MTLINMRFNMSTPDWLIRAALPFHHTAIRDYCVMGDSDLSGCNVSMDHQAGSVWP